MEQILNGSIKKVLIATLSSNVLINTIRKKKVLTYTNNKSIKE